MIHIYFLGVTSALEKKLADYVGQLKNQEGYDLNSRLYYQHKKDWRSFLPRVKKGILFYELSYKSEVREANIIKELQIRHPLLQWVLLADNKLNYFNIAQSYKIGNILKKNKFDFFVIRALAIRLMTGNLFGFGPYFPDGFSEGPHSITFETLPNTEELLDRCQGKFIKYVGRKHQGRVKTYLYELLINTLYYAFHGITEEERDKDEVKIYDFKGLKSSSSGRVMMVADNEKYGFSVMDSSGSLSLDRLLKKLRRQSRIKDEETPPGLWDVNGRGLSLIHKDNRLIVNILKGVCTEIIFLHYKKEEFNKFESVIITQVRPASGSI
jgi:hypothetical protein